MIITITVKDDKVLEAINTAWKRAGRPEGLKDPEMIDIQDIAMWIVPNLEIDDSDIEIERD